MLKLSFFSFVCLFEFNVPHTAKGILRLGHILKSHLTDWPSGRSNLKHLLYKSSDLSTTPQRLLSFDELSAMPPKLIQLQSEKW